MQAPSDADTLSRVPSPSRYVASSSDESDADSDVIIEKDIRFYKLEKVKLKIEKLRVEIKQMHLQNKNIKLQNKKLALEIRKLQN